jgi:sugar-specific transcriptional regulator TrmB
MNIVNGKEREVVELLRGYGLNGYEAKAYFTLLAVGESKAGDVARKAGVPQSKVYDVLDTLREKGFVEQNEDTRPKEYKAFSLKDTTEKVAALRTREIVGLRKSMEKLKRVLESVAPIHNQYETYRLFAPRYRTWKTTELTPLDEKSTSSESSLPLCLNGKNQINGK